MSIFRLDRKLMLGWLLYFFVEIFLNDVEKVKYYQKRKLEIFLFRFDTLWFKQTGLKIFN